jgi:type II secretory pathway component GspD/PulD (secretin)
MASLTAMAAPERLTGDVSVTVHPVALHETLPIAGASRIVTMSFRGVPLADALRALARKGGFNVVVDESVQGTVSVDLDKVSIQNALETFKTSGHLAYAVQGDTLAVATADSPRGQSFLKSSTRIFRLKHANARVVANFLNQTVFADRTAAAGGGAGGASGGASGGSSGGSGAGGNASGLTVTPDAQTNSLIVLGTPADIRTVEEHLEALDQPRQRRTWRLSHANALDVASILASSVFNEGQPVLLPSSGGGSGGGSGSAGGAQTGLFSNLRVTAENIAEGSGTTQADQGSQGGGSSGGGSEDSALVGNLTLRAKVKQTQNVQISPNGPILIPDTRLNTLTLLGTAEQIATVEAFLPTLDRKMPQVALEASLVEISETGRRELGYSMGANTGYFSTGTNNLPTGGASALVNKAFSNAIGRPTATATPLESIFRFNTNPVTRARDFVYQINALVSRNKAKLLANPTVVTTSDNETMISMVDEIIRSVTITVGTNSGVGSTTTATDNIG